MVKTSDILNFAYIHKVFTRKELIANLMASNQISSRSSLSEQLNRLINSGQLIRLERGIYKLPDDAKKDFSVVCSIEMEKINQQIKNQFPFVDYCLWSGSALMPFMRHIPNRHLMFVDVEREVAESVFNFLNSRNNMRVFLMPTLSEFERYVNTDEAIIIRPLITESPLQLIEDIYTPTIEKILVDLVGDVEFSFLQGEEINYVYATIFEKHHVNKNKLLRYATRRGRKEEVQDLLKINQL